MDPSPLSVDSPSPTPVSATTTVPPAPSANPSASLLTLPAPIIQRIAFHLFHPATQALYTTCHLVHNLLINNLCTSLALTTPLSLSTLLGHLNTSNRPSCITTLTLSWLHTDPLPPLTLHHLLSYTPSLITLTLTFPRAGHALQSALLKFPLPTTQHPLTHLHISQPAPFLLCAISALCSHTLEILVLDGTKGEYEALHAPGACMFRNFEKLGRLRELRLKGREGFRKECLEWVLGGREEGKAVAVVVASGAQLEGRFEQLDMMGLGREERGRENTAAKPTSWWTSKTPKAMNDAAFTSICHATSLVQSRQARPPPSNSLHQHHRHHYRFYTLIPTICRNLKPLNSHPHRIHIHIPTPCHSQSSLSPTGAEAEYIKTTLSTTQTFSDLPFTLRSFNMLFTPPASPRPVKSCGDLRLRGGGEVVVGLELGEVGGWWRWGKGEEGE